MTKEQWRRSYGDGECTEDYVLWVNGEPTDTYISEVSTKCYALYIEGEEVGLFNTIKEAKDYYYHR